MAKNNFFGEILESVGNEYARCVEDGIVGGDINSYIDTGSYSLNALCSGSIYGGVPGNKITMIAGEESTGKTFFVLSMVKTFLDKNEEAGVIYFESENALSKDMLEERGIDVSRVYIVPVGTIEQFRTQASRVLDKYIEQKEAERKPLMLVLDSLGMLSTNKEVGGVSEGSETRDMTRAPLIRGAFRVLTLKCGVANVPLLVTNHTYSVIGSMFPTKEIGGGGGPKFSASTIVVLSRKKEKDGTEVVGNVIHCKLEKARFTKENSKIDVLLRYDSGLNKYYGLVPIAEKYQLFKKTSTRYELPDGTKVFEKQLYSNPEKYFTQEILEKINDFCSKEFLYGSSSISLGEEKEEND